MKAYETIRFIEFPDVGDIREQGRKSCVGGKERGYSRKASKNATRRRLKRSDRARSLRMELRNEQ